MATVIVGDTCDPSPVFVLTSATSNEPDDGLGDGDFPGDIQEARFGEVDTHLLLRSERSGLGEGRIYTAVYTATDASGNDADGQDIVRAPHDRRGVASPFDGFSEDGARLLPGAGTVCVGILSTESLDATKIVRPTAAVGNVRGAVGIMAVGIVDLN